MRNNEWKEIRRLKKYVVTHLPCMGSIMNSVGKQVSTSLMIYVRAPYAGEIVINIMPLVVFRNHF